jgi:hypothetical protein
VSGLGGGDLASFGGSCICSHPNVPQDWWSGPLAEQAYGLTRNAIGFEQLTGDFPTCSLPVTRSVLTVP